MYAIIYIDGTCTIVFPKLAIPFMYIIFVSNLMIKSCKEIVNSYLKAKMYFIRYKQMFVTATYRTYLYFLCDGKQDYIQPFLF